MGELVSNILLDEKLDAKVFDFGLSRLVVNGANHVTTCAQGTLGYLDPEYYLNFQLTDKSDDYSFGVVLLELLSSKKAIDFNREEEDLNLVVYMKRVFREERLMDTIDHVLKDKASHVELESMKALGSLATACLDQRSCNRPSMKQVADEISTLLVYFRVGFQTLTCMRELERTPCNNILLRIHVGSIFYFGKYPFCDRDYSLEYRIKYICFCIKMTLVNKNFKIITCILTFWRITIVFGNYPETRLHFFLRFSLASVVKC